jgi:hypothetical protein
VACQWLYSQLAAREEFMENTNKYISGMILAAAAIVFGGFTFLRGAVRTYNQIDPDISYSMPRPKGALYTLLFGLEGREVQYQEVDPFANKAAGSAAGAKDSLRKDGKNAAKIDPKKAAKNAKAGTPTAAPKKPEVKVNVVSAPPKDPLLGSADGVNPETVAPGAAGQAAADAANNTTKPADNTLSAAQWRALILGQPTKENIAKLVEAFNRKEVDVNTLYLIENDLMQSSNTDTQAAGLLLAQDVPSLKSFSVVADNYDKLSTGNKTTADSYLATYMQPSRLSILALALKSSDTVVASRAAQVMVTGLQQVKNGTTPNQPRAGRGVVASGKTNAYSQFIPILQQLSQSGDTSLAGLAQSALSQIQSLSNA